MWENLQDNLNHKMVLGKLVGSICLALRQPQEEGLKPVKMRLKAKLMLSSLS
jgi:hypothetical protein